MATKKTVKKAPAVVKATPEAQEVRADGEHNKYPVYHGCIRFDDDNIVEVSIRNNTPMFLYNGQPLKTYSGANMLAVLTDDLPAQTINYRLSKAYFTDDVVVSTTQPLLYINDNARAYAFKGNIPNGALRITSSSLSHVCDIWVNNQPSGNIMIRSNPDNHYRNIRLHCCFPRGEISDNTIISWGFYSPDVVTFDETFPTETEFFEMYGG